MKRVINEQVADQIREMLVNEHKENQLIAGIAEYNHASYW